MAECKTKILGPGKYLHINSLMGIVKGDAGGWWVVESGELYAIAHMWFKRKRTAIALCDACVRDRWLTT
jgi:hypothetical protein